MVPQKLILANRRDKDIHKYRRCRDDEASYQTSVRTGLSHFFLARNGRMPRDKSRTGFAQYSPPSKRNYFVSIYSMSSGYVEKVRNRLH